ncbi:MAG: hypothetical protein ACFB0E_21475 [Leptolyngbyaceae cyanobacterium]
MPTLSFWRSAAGCSSMIALLLAPGSASWANRSDRPSDPVTAGGTQFYRPPADSQRPQDNHTTGGVRGCGDDIAALLPA